MVELSLPSGQVLDFGDSSDQEIESLLKNIRIQQPELFEQPETKPNLETASFEELRSYYGKDGVSQAQEIKPTHSGEVKDLGLSYFVGRGDTDEERLTRLQTVFGQQGVTKVGPDDFFLNLDNITEDVKDKYNLPESGTIRFNEPGLGWQDVSSFLGRETVPLVAALGTSVAASGVGILPGVLLVGAAGAAPCFGFIHCHQPR